MNGGEGGVLANDMAQQNGHSDDMMEAIVKGDKKAFEQLFRKWYVRLCVYTESIVHDPDVAEDLVQNIFCMLWEKRTLVNVRESVKSYLYRSAYHASLNVLKHEKVKLAFAEFLQKHGEQDENNIDCFFDDQNHQMLVREMNRAIAALPQQCREIFLLSRFAGKKSVEIAEMLHLSVRTVETQLYRAMKRLREELGHWRNAEILFCIIFSKKL